MSRIKKFNEDYMIQSKIEQVYDNIEKAINEKLPIVYNYNNKEKTGIPVNILSDKIELDNGDVIKDFDVVGLVNEGNIIDNLPKITQIMITNFKMFENVEMWNNFIDKVNKGIIPKDPPDVGNIEKIINLKPSGKVLDLSVGDGAQSEYFIEKGYDVYGTDISNLAIKTIKEKHPEYTWFIHDTENKFPFQNNMFDIVFVRLAIHYFSKESINNILSDIYRIMKESGILFIMVKVTNTGEEDTGKKFYSQEEWNELISEKFNIIDEIFEIKRAYSFEKTPSNILQIFAKKEEI